MAMTQAARRHWLAHAGAAALAAWTVPAQAASVWPTRALRLLVPLAPQGSAEGVAQAVATELSRSLGQRVQVEFAQGAAAHLALQEAAQPGDGHTLVLGHLGMLVAQPDAIGQGLVPVALLCKVPVVYAVPPGLAAPTLTEMLALARAAPGQLSYGSTGVASTAHLAAEYLKTASDTFMLHLPYPDADAVLSALLAGRVSLAALDAPTLAPHVQAGRLRALATGSAARLPSWPELATVAEQGHPGFEVTQWYGLLAPRQWPRTHLWTLEAHAIRAVRSARVRAQWAADAIASVGTTGAEFDTFIQAEQARWKPVLARARIRAKS